MRTNSYTIADVEHFSQYFAPLKFDPAATRELHMQATSVCWTDEMPELTEDNYEASFKHFFIYLFSYRKMLMYGEDVAEFRPLWRRLKELCPNWRGFRPERMTVDLIPELDSAIDAMLQQIEDVFEARRRKVDEQR